MSLQHKKKSIKDFIIGDWIRECQSCGNIQGDTPPHGEPTQRIEIEPVNIVVQKTWIMEPILLH